MRHRIASAGLFGMMIASAAPESLAAFGELPVHSANHAVVRERLRRLLREMLLSVLVNQRLPAMPISLALRAGEDVSMTFQRPLQI